MKELLNQHLAKDLERYADMLENGELVSPDEMNCASVMRLAVEVLTQSATPTKHEHEPTAYQNEGVGVIRYADISVGTIIEKSPLPQRTWVHATTWRGLTDEERNVIIKIYAYPDNIIKATEAKLKEKNT